MTNEELVISIQKGQTEYIAELWRNLSPFIKWCSSRIYSKYAERFQGLGVTREDLYQEAYFYTLNAIKAYQEQGYKFTTFLACILKNSYYKLAGLASNADKERAQLVIGPDRLESIKFTNKDGNSKTNEAYLFDEQAEQELNCIIGDDEQINLHEDLQDAINDLPSIEANLITDKYFKDCRINELSKKLHLSKTQVHNIEQKALTRLRRDSRLEKYNRFRREKQKLMNKHEIGYRFTKFRERQMSSQESYVIQLEELEAQYGIK